MWAPMTRGSIGTTTPPAMSPPTSLDQATRWAEPVSNLFGAGDDNPNGAIVDFTFAVAFNPVTAVEAKGKLATVWGDLRK